MPFRLDVRVTDGVDTPHLRLSPKPGTKYIVMTQGTRTLKAWAPLQLTPDGVWVGPMSFAPNAALDRAILKRRREAALRGGPVPPTRRQMMWDAAFRYGRSRGMAVLRELPIRVHPPGSDHLDVATQREATELQLMGMVPRAKKARGGRSFVFVKPSTGTRPGHDAERG